MWRFTRRGLCLWLRVSILLYLLFFLLDRLDRGLTIDEICRRISLQIDEVSGLRIVARSTGLIHSYLLLFELLNVSHVHVINAWRLLYGLSHWIAFLMAGPLRYNFEDMTTFDSVLFDKVFGRSLLLNLWSRWKVFFADHFNIEVWHRHHTVSVSVLLTLLLLDVDVSDCLETTRVHRLLSCLWWLCRILSLGLRIAARHFLHIKSWKSLHTSLLAIYSWLFCRVTSMKFHFWRWLSGRMNQIWPRCRWSDCRLSML